MKKIAGIERIPSPALLLDPEKVQSNLQRMISMAGVERLRPHLKTHKMREVVRMQIGAGIKKFKASTLAELEMAAAEGADDVLLAMQPVGPNVDRLAKAMKRFPNTKFSALVDHVESAEELDRRCASMTLFIDVDCGMHRTGIGFGSALRDLIGRIEGMDQVELGGLHVYDGHLRDPSPEIRRAAVEEIHREVLEWVSGSMTVITGGSPTFGIWAEVSAWDCSPGTTLFWDQGYAELFPDLPFEIAATLLTRVVSKPGGNRLCLDLGHKAVAAENPLERRVLIPALSDLKFLGQSEEHLVVETPEADRFKPGDAFSAYPRHICPTVALHRCVHLIHNRVYGEETWTVAARDR